MTAPSIAAALARVAELDAKATPGPWDCWDMDEFGWHVFADKFGTRNGGQNCDLSIAAVRYGRSHDTRRQNYEEQVSNAAFIAESRTLLPLIAGECERRAGAIALLRDTLSAAGAKFREYEAGHAAKRTDEGARKAKTNARMAEMCEAALRSRAAGQERAE